MKVIILLLFSIGIITSGFGQSTIAKLKYEEAEEAYASNNFDLTLAKLKEVEILLASTNHRILYLQIMAQSKLIETNPLSDFTILENGRNSAAKYLKDYEAIPDNEDKYRNIYKVSEKLKLFPATNEDFEELKRQDAITAQENRLTELSAQKSHEDAFMSFVYFKEYKIGLTLEETLKAYPSFKKHYTFKNENKDNTSFDYSIAKKAGPYYGDLSGFHIKNNKTIGYFGNILGSIYDERTENDNTAIKMVNDIKKKLTNEFNFNPKEVNTEATTAGYSSNKSTSYTWDKNNKNIALSHSRLVETNGQIHHFILIVSLDQNLAN